MKTHGHGQMSNSKSCTTVNGISGQYGAIAMKNVIFAFAILASGLAVAPIFLYGEKIAKRLFDGTNKELKLHQSANSDKF